MAGAEAAWEGGLVVNSVTVVDVPTISVGVTEAPGEEYEVLSEVDEDRYTYRKIVLEGDRIVGAVFVGEIDRAGIITGLIRERIDVSGIQVMRNDADSIHYRELNERIHQAVADGETELLLDNVLGHRYIGAGLKGGVSIEINGIPGNDLAGSWTGPRSLSTRTLRMA